MASLTELLENANTVGLTILCDGDQLVVRGPTTSAAIASELLARKREVLAHVAATAGNSVEDCQEESESTSPWCDGWPAEAMAPDAVGHCPDCGGYQRWLPIGKAAWKCLVCEPPRIPPPDG